MYPQTTQQALIPERLVALRYGVSARTLPRWDQIPALRFPPPIYVNGRRYREVAALDRWDIENSRKAAAWPATPRTGRPRKAKPSPKPEAAAGEA
jgi:hypothetical protein